jgi:GH15 family glucan-1,4-alpha-glucosidase
LAAGQTQWLVLGYKQSIPGPLDRHEQLLDSVVDCWNKTRTKICETILKRRYNGEIGSFVRSFETDDQLDAAVFRIRVVDFLPTTDYRMEQTLDAIKLTEQ